MKVIITPKYATLIADYLCTKFTLKSLQKSQFYWSLQFSVLLEQAGNDPQDLDYTKDYIEEIIYKFIKNQISNIKSK